MKTTSIVLVLISFCFVSPVIAENASGTQATAASIATSPQIKSILFPGWGQLYTGHRLKGTVFMTGEALLMGLAIHYGVRGSRFYDKYKSTTDPEAARRFRRKTISFDKKRNIAVACALGIWTINILDIYFAGSNKQSQPKIHAGPVSIRSLRFGYDGSDTTLVLAMAL